MAKIIYGERIIDKSGLNISKGLMRETFSRAIAASKQLHDKRVAYFFIDPVMHGFEAGNHFYFEIFACQVIQKLNYYRSGAGPLHALNDACQLIDNNLFDAVFIFGFEPLLSNKRKEGKQAVKNAMDIFDGTGLLECYNRLGEHMCDELNLSKQQFATLADCLFDNYAASRIDEVKPERGRYMDDAMAPLFRLTDCANPNLDFAGGIIVSNQSVARQLGMADTVDVVSVQQATVEADPSAPQKIVGDKNCFFPHIQKIIDAMQKESRQDIHRLLAEDNLLLDIYTCYPPIPLGFLLASKLAPTIKDIPEFLQKHAITLEGGLNLAGAPWNNPVLSSLVSMYHLLLNGRTEYGLLHGNGGIGENQAVALLKKAN